MRTEEEIRNEFKEEEEHFKRLVLRAAKSDAMGKVLSAILITVSVEKMAVLKWALEEEGCER